MQQLQKIMYEKQWIMIQRDDRHRGWITFASDKGATP